jgi:hypothetical protein
MAKVEVLDKEGRVVDTSKFKGAKKLFGGVANTVVKYWKKVKLIIAMLLDFIDLFLGFIPLVNTAFDIVSFLILLVILRNKKLAAFALVELPLFGLPPFSIIDMFLPICTIIVMMDNNADSMQEGVFGKVQFSR